MTKAPTPQGISRLLRDARCIRADRKLHGGITGYTIRNGPAYGPQGTVLVGYWSIISFTREQELRELARYAKVIEAAGYATRYDENFRRLVVTAGEG